MFEAVVVLEFDQTANLGAEKGHGLWTNPSGADVDLNLEQEFRADLGVVNQRCVSGSCGGAWVGVVLAPAGCGECWRLLCRRIEVVQSLRSPLF